MLVDKFIVRSMSLPVGKIRCISFSNFLYLLYGSVVFNSGLFSFAYSILSVYCCVQMNEKNRLGGLYILCLRVQIIVYLWFECDFRFRMVDDNDLAGLAPS